MTAHNEDVVYTLNAEIKGVDIQVKTIFSLNDSKKWTLNDKKIVYFPTSGKVEVTGTRYYDTLDGSFIAESTHVCLTVDRYYTASNHNDEYGYALGGCRCLYNCMAIGSWGQ